MSQDQQTQSAKKTPQKLKTEEKTATPPSIDEVKSMLLDVLDKADVTPNEDIAFLQRGLEDDDIAVNYEVNIIGKSGLIKRVRGVFTLPTILDTKSIPDAPQSFEGSMLSSVMNPCYTTFFNYIKERIDTTNKDVGELPETTSGSEFVSSGDQKFLSDGE